MMMIQIENNEYYSDLHQFMRKVWTQLLTEWISSVLVCMLVDFSHSIFMAGIQADNDRTCALTARTLALAPQDKHLQLM